MKINLDQFQFGTKIDQIFEAIRFWIESGEGKSGIKMPSIRQFASKYSMSPFTVIQAYDRLVAAGLITSKKGSGFYVADNLLLRSISKRLSSEDKSNEIIKTDWNLFNDHPGVIKFGCGWLPKEWRPNDEISGAIRKVSRKNHNGMIDYSTPPLCASDSETKFR